MARILAQDDALDEALATLQAGLPVAIPTETVYGLAADAASGEAVARIYEAKGRPRFNPLIAHVSDMTMAGRVAVFDPFSRRLAEALWPGPLTMVLSLADGAPIHPLMRAGLDTVAVRMPKGFAAELIAHLGRPLAAPSANSSGRVSGTTAQAVDADLGARIPLIVDGGPTPVGVESTIVKVEGDEVLLLRPGGVTVGEIEQVVGPVVRRRSGGTVEAPGMLASHYAPAARVRTNATDVRAGEALLAFGSEPPEGARHAVSTLNLSPSANLREAAANLFSHLQSLDASGARVIAAAPIPLDGLGEAINDRLARAAAPRDIPEPRQ